MVGKKETIYPLVEELRKMQEKMAELGEQFRVEGEIAMPEEEFADMQTDYLHLLRAVIRMLDGAKYLWEGECGKEQE